MIGSNLNTCKLIKVLGYKHREDAVGGGGSRQYQTHTPTHTHTVSPVIHRVDGASGKDRTQSGHM